MTTTELMFATKPEKAVYYVLVRLGEVFDFQSQMLGAHGEKGSTRADFLLPEHSLVISVIGWYFHNRPESKARDRLQRIALESQGYQIIYIDEQDALDNADHYVREAIRGVDHSRYRYLV